MNLWGVCQKTIKEGLFFCVALLILYYLTNLLCAKDYYPFIKGFYFEPKETIDAVYIGNSSVYYYWQAPWAWKKYGIAVYPFSSGGQPIEAIPYLIKEVRKRQPEALIIVSLNAHLRDLAYQHIHHLADWIPASFNKQKMLYSLSFSGEGGDNFADNMEYYFPIIRFHTRWDKLSVKDFHPDRESAKNGFIVNDVYDVSSGIGQTDKKEPLPDYYIWTLEHLLDYCDQKEVRILFTISPQFLDNELYWARLNTAKDIIRSRNYPVLDMNALKEEMMLDPAKDFHDGKHVNIFGALKFTDYFARYLVRRYEFEDKREVPEFESWNSSADDYIDKINSMGWGK